MAEDGLRKWVNEKWVDIGAPKKNGKYQPCGRSKGTQKEISKMRPTCKSHTDDKLAKGECCQTKKSSGNPGGKPTNVATFTKRKKEMGGI